MQTRRRAMLAFQRRVGSSPGQGDSEMDLLNGAINAVVVTAIGLALVWLGRGEFQALARRFEAVDARSDLTQIALAVGVRPRATNG